MPLTFHGVEPRALLLPYQVDFPNVSLPDQLDLVETRRADLHVADFDRIGAIRSSKIQQAVTARRR